MIISASRRTDIPAFFTDWFMNRIREQYACVRNPFNAHQVSKIVLNPDVVDCIVFWSKNPEPMRNRLAELQNYMYYFQYSLNAYGEDIETNLPILEKRIATFQGLSQTLGKQRVLWRYDPILLNETYTFAWHIETFSRLAGQLCGYTDQCTISFIDMYPAIAGGVKQLGIRELPASLILALAKELSSIADSCGLTLVTCSEQIDLSCYNIGHSSCIDSRLISQLLGCSILPKKDKNQRPECGCASSIDLGTYNTCRNGCVYCYANHCSRTLEQPNRMYDKNSPILCGRLAEQDKVSVRSVKSLKAMQLDMFSQIQQ